MSKFKLDTLKDLNIKSKVDKIIYSPGDIINEWKEKRGYVDVYRIKKNRDKNKAIIFIHGGSFTELSARDECYQYFAYVLCEMTGYDIIMPDFTLPPLKQYPHQLEDIIRVYNYFSNSGYKDIILGGDSSGGCIAFSTLLKYPTLFSAGFIISGWLNLNSDTISYKTREYCNKTHTGDIIFRSTAKENKKLYKKYALKYLGDKTLFNDPIANPYLADNNLLSKLPPICFMVGDEETIRNDTLNIGAKGQICNKNIFIYLYDLMWHDWIFYLENNSKLKGIDAYVKIANFCNGNIKNGKYYVKNQSIESSVSVDIVL